MSRPVGVRLVPALPRRRRLRHPRRAPRPGRPDTVDGVRGRAAGAACRCTRDDAGPSTVADLLVDLDEGMQEWRYRHVKMVERTIGGKSGTGGSAGAAYLRTHPVPRRVPGPLGRAERAVTTAGRPARRPERAVRPLRTVRGRRPAAAHRALAPGVAGRRAARPDRGVRRRGRGRGRQVGPGVREGGAAAAGVPGPARRPGRRHRAGRQHPRAGRPLPVQCGPARAGRGSSPPTASSTRCAASSPGSPRRASRSCGCRPHPVDTLAERLAGEVDRPHRGRARVVRAVRDRRGSCRTSAASRRRARVPGCGAARRRLPRARRRAVLGPRAGPDRRVGHRRRLQVPAAGRGQLLPAPARARGHDCGR